MSAPSVHGYTDQPRGDEPRSRSWSRVPTQADQRGSGFTGTWDAGAAPAPVVQEPAPSWGYADDGSWVGAAGAPAGNEWWTDERGGASARSANWGPPPPPVDEGWAAPEGSSARRKSTNVALGIGVVVALVVVGIVAFAGTVLFGGGSGGSGGGKADLAGGTRSGAPAQPGGAIPTGGYPDMPQPTTAPTTPGAAATTHAPAPTKAPTTKAPMAPGGALANPVQEGAVLSLVNKYRGQNGCKSLSFDSKLSNAARKHSQDMAVRHYFSHDTPEGVSMAARIAAEGYKWSMVGENIAEGQRDADAVMTAWMNSPGHRANILNCKYTQIGIGLAYQGKTPVWTQDFGTPP